MFDSGGYGEENQENGESWADKNEEIYDRSRLDSDDIHMTLEYANITPNRNGDGDDDDDDDDENPDDRMFQNVRSSILGIPEHMNFIDRYL